MKTILDIVRGIVIGIANVIPGVSGGTMAVSMGIYDKLIGAINGLTKNFMRSVRILAPLLVGMAIGVVVFSYLVEYLLAQHTLATCLTFVGLILGGLPVLWPSLKKSIAKKPGGLFVLEIVEKRVDHSDIQLVFPKCDDVCVVIAFAHAFFTLAFKQIEKSRVETGCAMKFDLRKTHSVLNPTEIETGAVIAIELIQCGCETPSYLQALQPCFFVEQFARHPFGTAIVKSA